MDEKKLPGLNTPNGWCINDGTSFLLVADSGTGTLHRIKLADGTAEKVADGFGRGRPASPGTATAGCTFRLRRWASCSSSPGPATSPGSWSRGSRSAADICLDPSGKSILVPDMKAGTLTAVPAAGARCRGR